MCFVMFQTNAFFYHVFFSKVDLLKKTENKLWKQDSQDMIYQIEYSNRTVGFSTHGSIQEHDKYNDILHFKTLGPHQIFFSFLHV